jgi:endonuclease/exonuclease/phosphatase family metal-dependent hydrolase
LDNGEQRGVLEVQADLPGFSHPLLFLATHLDHRPKNEERLASAQAILDITADQPDQPALLAGDLNDLPESAVLNRFGQQWSRANVNVLPTIPVENPRRQIDYILLRPSARWRVIETKVVNEAVASDHRPIFATLELLPDSN